MQNKKNQEDNPEPTVLVEKQLGFLIRRYLAGPTQSLAQAIVVQLEGLLQHPDCIGYPDYRCGYRKMLQHWRTLL